MKLKIGYRDIQVLPMTTQEAIQEKKYGYYLDGVIKVEDPLDPPEQARVLIHEIIHAIFDTWAIPNKRFTQEAICKTLDKPLAALFRDNPHLGEILNNAFTQNKGLF